MDYDFELVHIAGTKNGRADALSRRSDHDEGEDNKHLVILPPKFFAKTYAQLAGSEEADPSNPYQWRRITKGLDNEKYASLQERITKNQQESDRSKEQIQHWTNTHQMMKHNDTWWKEDRIVVAGDNNLKRGVIHYFHDTPSAGHPGITNTYEIAKRDVWWPNMEQDVEQYIKGCAVCQANKIVTDLQGPPSERTPEQKLWDFKTRAQQYACDRESCDDVRISYLEFLETEAEDDLALARMIAG
jgi:hypothetical protein